MKLIKNLRHYNFPKIIREIRLHINKPMFRYWNKRTFWYSNRMQFATNSYVGYTFKKKKFKKLVRNRLWKLRREEYEERKRNKNAYRRKWYHKKTRIKKNKTEQKIANPKKNCKKPNKKPSEVPPKKLWIKYFFPLGTRAKNPTFLSKNNLEKKKEILSLNQNLETSKLNFFFF